MTIEKQHELLKYEALFDEYINDEAYKDRPKRYDDFYIKIENIQDYEYTYVLAYELSQKNQKVKKHFQKANYYASHLDEYANEITDFYHESINLGYSSFLEEKNNKVKNSTFFNISDTNLTINDIEQFEFDLEVEHIGLWKLIAYLIDTNNLYKRNNYKVIDNNNEAVTREYCELMDINEVEIKINDIMSNPNNYATYCKNQYNDTKELTILSKDMPLDILDETFLHDLTMIRIKDKNSNASVNYSVPTLKFKDQTVVNFPINLKLDVEELKAYITKIKEDFDNKKSITKSPIEIFGEKLSKAESPKSEKILPSLDKIKRKKAIADAFYIYDLYKYIEEIYKNKKEGHREYYTNDIHVDVALASGISKVHNEILENESGLNEINKSNRLEKYYKLMCEYIEGEKYKELITGVKINEVSGMWDNIPSSPIFSKLTQDN